MSSTDNRTSATSNYGYDNIYQLTSAIGGSAEDYSYDLVGNRLTSTGVPNYTVNSSNQLTSTSNATYTYDNNGNTLTKVDSTGTTSYAWDFENRLTSVTLPGSGGTVSFVYDPFGRRIKKSSSSGASVYVYDGADQLQEADSTGATVVARYTMGAGIDQPLAETRGTTTSFYQADGLGSVTSLTDSTAAIANTYTYDSFGNQTASSGTVVNPFRYTARELDSETGLMYYRSRYYDTGVGRFLSEDPNVMEASISMYTYGENSPATYVDPLGFGKQKPMPALQPGVGQDQAEAIAKGFHEALNRLKGGNCAKFFGCKPNDPSSAAAQELQKIEWGIFTDKQRTNLIAHTYTDSDKAEFNTASNVFDNGDPVWGSPNPEGMKPRYRFGDSESLLAFYMLHELAHHFPGTGFQPDAGPGLEAINERNSLMLIKACFLDATRLQK